MASRSLTKRKKIFDKTVKVPFTPDEILFKEIPKVFNMDKKDFGFILSIYLAMKGLRTGALAHSFKKQNVIEDFFANNQSLHPVNYRIYPEREPYQNMFKILISTNSVPDDLVNTKGYMNHIELGKFLGYPCPRNMSDPKTDHLKKKKKKN